MYHKTKNYKYRVKLPDWWTKGEKCDAYTDKIDTYCCDSTASWFVIVYKNQHFYYAGYFKKFDLQKEGE